jgi:hypothetical protein
MVTGSRSRDQRDDQAEPADPEQGDAEPGGLQQTVVEQIGERSRCDLHAADPGTLGTGEHGDEVVLGGVEQLRLADEHGLPGEIEIRCRLIPREQAM